MRFIAKGTPPTCMTEWIAEQAKAGIVARYRDFREKGELNAVLRIEQRHVCCYCQQRISHYQGANAGGSHNEHLVPQKGSDGDALLEMDYGNIYACCNYSAGVQKGKNHCGQAKGDMVMANLIQRQACSSYFKYNTVGEILPNGDYSRIKDYETHCLQLPLQQQEALQAITVLQLNCTYLVAERKKTQTHLFQALTRISKEKIQQQIADFEANSQFHPFIDMLLYYMKQKVA